MASRPPTTPVRPRPGPHAQSPAPATPGSGTAEPGRLLAARLNQQYNLGLQLPSDDHPQSPVEQERLARSDAQRARQNSIVQLLRLHHYRDPGRLQAVLDQFDSIARPRARSGMGAGATAALQATLLTLLETSKAALLKDMKTSPIRTTPVVNPELSPAVAKHLPARDAIATDIDQVPVRQRLGAPALRPTTKTNAAVERWVHGEGSGHGASSTSAATETERPASPAASSVIAASSATSVTSDMFFDSFEDAHDSPEPAHDGAYQEDDGYTTEEFAASDGVLEALEESFSQLQQQPPHSPTASVKSVLPGLGSLRISDDNDDDEAAGRDRAATAKTKPSARTPKKMPNKESPSVPGLRGRLDGIFPPTPAWLQGAPFPIIWETTRIALRCGVDLGQEPSAPPPAYSAAWEESQALFRTALAENPMFHGRRLPEPLSDVTWEAAMDRLPVLHGLGTRRVPVYMIQLHFSESAKRGTARATPSATPRKKRMDDDGPLYHAQLLPIATDLPHRLGRHYGTERFIEVLFPSHHSSKSAVPRILYEHDAAVQVVNAWLTRQRHEVAGRRWAAFYVKDGGSYKKPDSVWDRQTSMQPSGSKDQETIFLKRVFLFAEESTGCAPAEPLSRLHTGPLDRVTVYEMLDWLLRFNQFPANRKQPYLKLFSRISLGLSRTKPTVVFQPHQIRHRRQDLLSPTGKVMNDGIGRMSLSVARKLRSALELSDLPTAVQGRIGSAKGMWILDTDDPGRADWIETYPSQRKWLLGHGDFSQDGYSSPDDVLDLDRDLDPDQRTLEIRHFASEIGRSSRLNLQFIPLVEDRAVDKPRMRRTLARILAGDLTRDLAAQRDALRHPLLLSAWVQENARFRNNHLSTYGGEAVGGQVPFLGGRPDGDEDTIQFLLAGGFHPLQQQYLWEKVYSLQKTRCKRLQSNLSVRIGRAAHLLMVVDFLGVLEEGEVQVCFSSKFKVDADTPSEMGEMGLGLGSEDEDDGDDGSFSDTLLVGRDVLVARSPAHFPGDMQRVRAVFHPELSALKDVVIFSRKGDSPLADKLSGGDYDGDMAWVCWDPRIVDNFENAPEPQETISLTEMGYMRKIKTTMEELADAPVPGKTTGYYDYPAASLDELLEKSFAFNMRENLLGKITAYKEKLCYFRGSIGDRTALVLSSLLSDLVDQAKQGNIFTGDDFERLRRECLGGLQGGSDSDSGPPPAIMPLPAYKQERPGRGHGLALAPQTDSIIDFLKFDVADPIIERELAALEEARTAMSQELADSESCSQGQGGSPVYGFYDMDLAAPARHFEALASKSAVCHAIFAALEADINDVSRAWDESTTEWKQESLGLSHKASDSDDPGYPQRVLRVYNQWCAIGIRLPDAQDAAAAASASTPSGSRAPVTPRRKTSQKTYKAARGAAWSGAESESIPSLLQQEYLGDPVYSQWALIRASQTFRMLHRKQAKLLWNLAGRQLQVIKAMAAKTSTSTSANPHADNGTAGAKVMMTPLMYAASKPDGKTIKRMTARLTASSLFDGHEGDECDGDLYYDADDGYRLFADDT